jgi:4-amino-4-deoxy-L-arabinose transferase-like glycosyltransferase
MASDAEPHAGSALTFRWRLWVAAALVLIATARIIGTYSQLSETVDEVDHIGAGMEWFARGEYTFEPSHPPVARIAAAAGPYLLGIRSQNQSNQWFEGRQVLYADGAYLRNLTAARLGMLPFFFLAALFIWKIGRSVYGERVALAAVACFTLLPPVLAHFGLATTDGPMFALFAASIYAMIRWLREPNAKTGALLGLAVSLAVVSKFSALPYLGIVALLLFSARFWSNRDWPWRRSMVSLMVAGVVAFFAAWAVYRFSLGTLRGIPVPLSEIPKGFRDLANHNRYGHPAYFLGEVRAKGVWFFFPVMLGLKTPLAALLLGGAGIGAIVASVRRTRAWEPLVPIAIVTGVLAIAMVASLNIGVRHVLPVYIAISLAVAIGWLWTWELSSRRIARGVLVIATALLSLGTVTIHPDYLAYFNQLAGRDPSRLVADSDLDWGQDLFRLAREVERQRVDTLKFAYIGTADLSPIVGVPVKYWDGEGRPNGWVAVAETWYRRGQITFSQGAYQLRPDAMFWLDSAATPIHVGKGIRLYRIAR